MHCDVDAALHSACGPLVSPVLVVVFGGERLGRGQVAGVAIAFAGVLGFLAEKLAGGRWGQGAGHLVLLAATMAFSIHMVFARQVTQRVA